MHDLLVASERVTIDTVGGPDRISFERGCVATVLVGIAAPIALVGLLALRVPMLVAALAVGIVAVISVPRVARRLGRWLDGVARRHRLAAAAWSLLAIAAVAQTARLAAFMRDPNQGQHSVLPSCQDAREHSCLSAYVVAAALERSGIPNLYRLELYGGLDPPWRSLIGPLQVDPYEYPPTFLPLPLVALHLTHDFFAIRTVWFVLGAALLGITLVAQARCLGGPQGRFVALLSPALWITTPVLGCLQVGNFQIMAFVLPMLALFAFHAGRIRGGAAVLSAVIVGKIFPGVIGFDLLLRRRWRQAAWTAAFGIGFLAVALAVVRWDTFRSFLRYQLPRLSNGDAFPWMEGDSERMARAAAENLGIYGLVKKLQVLGVPGMSRHAAQVTAQFYGVLVIGFALLAARRNVPLLGRAQLWLAVLTLASMRSPFAPSSYATIGTLWLILLIAAERPSSWHWLAGWGAGFVLLWLLESRTTERPPMFDVSVGLGEQVLVLAVNLWIVLRRVPVASVSAADGELEEPQIGTL